MNSSYAEGRAYSRLLDAAVEAADRLQRSKLGIDVEAGNRLLKALNRYDDARGERLRALAIEAGQRARAAA